MIGDIPLSVLKQFHVELLMAYEKGGDEVTIPAKMFEGLLGTIELAWEHLEALRRANTLLRIAYVGAMGQAKNSDVWAQMTRDEAKCYMRRKPATEKLVAIAREVVAKAPIVSDRHMGELTDRLEAALREYDSVRER